MLREYVSRLINKKSVCILGFGREGRSTLNLFNEVGGFSSITICDLNPITDNVDAEIITGKDYQKNLDRFDIIMKSPGIVLEEGSLSDFSRLYSQSEVFLSVYRDKTIGITGTKGKSTTTTLIWHVLKECGKDAVLLGNIGIPCFDGEIKDDSIVVFEFSSHQLEYARTSPKVAVFLNIFPEHLDHYGTFEKYYNAKKNIYRYQKAEDIIIAGENVEVDSSSSLIRFGTEGDVIIRPNSFVTDNDEIILDSSCPLLGAHNVNNIAVAYTVVKEYGISKEAFLKALSTFKALPHRLEKIGEKDHVIYYDDSISTIPQTTIQALNSLPDVGTLLVGGMDRGIDYSPLIEFLKEYDIPNVIFMYDTGKRIIKEFGALPHKAEFHIVENLEDAVKLAKKITPKNTVCLLSPAAASYGFFKNFEDRGEKFKQFALDE